MSFLSKWSGEKGETPRVISIPDDRECYVVGVISDTHGWLSEELLSELSDVDLIVHAGDACSMQDYERLRRVAPVHMCLGNNDYGFRYGPAVKRRVSFVLGPFSWQIAHYQEDLTPSMFDVVVCGHTHVPQLERLTGGTLLINPGSPTHPRSKEGPTMVKVELTSSEIRDVRVIALGS